MSTLTLAICGERFNNGPKDFGWHIRRFAYLGEGVEQERPRDANYVMKLVNRLTDDNGVTQWQKGIPDASLDRLFDITVDVENHGKPSSRYSADYHKYNGCPLEAVKDGMSIYAAIRKNGIRPAMTNIRKTNEKQNLRLEREKNKPRFHPGAEYGYEGNDAFGHSVRNLATVISVNSDRTAARVRFSFGEKNVCIRNYDNSAGEYFTCGRFIVRATDRIAKGTK